MNDTTATLALIKEHVAAMVNEREWNEFHTLKNLSMNLSVEATELMELFLWCDSDKALDVLKEKRQAVEYELADVIIAAVAFANAAGIDIASAFQEKIEEVKAKYPVELAKGSIAKYTQYEKYKKQG